MGFRLYGKDRRGERPRYNVNTDTGGAGNRTFLAAMDEIIIPIVKKYEPELIVVSRVDAITASQTPMQMNTDGYVELCRRLFDISEGRIAFVLEEVTISGLRQRS